MSTGSAVRFEPGQSREVTLVPLGGKRHVVGFRSVVMGTLGNERSGTAVLPAYIVTEDLIEYHWLTDPNPRVFQLGLLGTLAQQHVIVKFGSVVVKGAPYAHYKVLVDR